MGNNHKQIDSFQVALAHDAMAEEYDQMDDLWYPWLFAQIHEFIAANLPDIKNYRPNALDVGCGTGLQSFLLSRAGYDVTAFDLASKLIEVAESKIPSQAVLPLNAPPLFTSKNWKGSVEHNNKISYLLEEKRSGRDIEPPRFFTADINDFDFEKKKYDIIICCGSVLSFLDNYEQVIKKMKDALKENGILLLEVEQKRNLDLIWPIVDNIIGGTLGYEQCWAEILNNLFSPKGKSVKIDYPFELHNGDEVTLPIWLFSVNELNRIFERNNLMVKDRLGIHSITNIFPSTILHRPDNGKFISDAAELLTKLDNELGHTWPFWRMGCSVIYCLHKL